jgi:hypothetical protein
MCGGSVLRAVVTADSRSVSDHCCTLCCKIEAGLGPGCHAGCCAEAQACVAAAVMVSGVTVHTVTPSVWRADYLYVDSVSQPTTTATCEAAFEVSAGTPGVVRAAKCKPFSELLFDLYGSGDPLNVSAAGVGCICSDHYSTVVATSRLRQHTV